MKVIHFSVAALLSFAPAAVYAHADSATYILGAAIVFLQLLSWVLILPIKLPWYSISGLLSIPALWGIVFLISDGFINMEPVIPYVVGLLLSPFFILLAAIVHSRILKRKQPVESQAG